MACRAPLLFVAAALMLSSCGDGPDGALSITLVGTSDSVLPDNELSSPGDRYIHAATHVGLVAFDAQGGIIPGLADRWIVADDGLSFIFRLRNGTWPNGEELSADSVRIALARRLRELRGTELGLDLAAVDEVRAMAGRVVEIRLSSPVATLLQLLAQPEMTLVRGEDGAGDMRVIQQDAGAILLMKAPSARGLPEDEDWQEHVRPLQLHASSGRAAVRSFDEGRTDVVLGGRIGTWPFVDTGPLSRGTVRIDPAIGLFGLQVLRAHGLMEDAAGREAIAMAIDRNGLIEPLNISGWTATSRIVSPSLPGDRKLIGERWTDSTLQQRRATAARRVASWRSANRETETRLTVVFEDSSGDALGLDRLFRELSAQLATIGVVLERVSDQSEADLMLVDSVAKHASPIWFLNQFNCSLQRGLCSEEADRLVAEIATTTDTDARAALLADAETELTRANVFIPFGQPLRWSLVRSGVEGFAANQWAFHPLPPFAQLAR